MAAAYDKLSVPYTDLFGSEDKLHARDRELVIEWSARTTGPILDAGCGPGHWTHLLAGTGRAAIGLDLSEDFLRGARNRLPDLLLVRASLLQLPITNGSLGGILAWYSVIHLPPEDLARALSGFASALADGGSLLLGFFDGEPGMTFEHKVARAHFWSAAAMTEMLAAAGFTTTQVERRHDPGSRPHLAMTAERTS